MAGELADAPRRRLRPRHGHLRAVRRVLHALEPLVIADLAPRRPIAADLLLGRERVRSAQVVKQADVLMLHHLVPEEVEPGSLAANLRFYEPRTAHASSLSPGIHAALLARAGKLDKALEALRLTARIDLDDLTGDHRRRCSPGGDGERLAGARVRLRRSQARRKRSTHRSSPPGGSPHTPAQGPQPPERRPRARAAAEDAGLELETASGTPFEALVQAAREARTRALVLGARGTPTGRRPAGRTALRLITSVSTPLIVVPPDARHPGRIDSVLVPLDGTPASAAALAGTIDLARGSGVEVIVLHVREHERLPRFSEHLQHEARGWAEEFIARNCPCPPEEVKLELRVGAPHEHVLDVARETGVDLIAMGWGQELTPGHAAVVREALARSGVPILLVPVEPRRSAPERT